MTVSKKVLYSGRVQGVGFRFTTQKLAALFKVTGYVRNLPSGEVELVAEGDSQEVASFLAALAQRMADHIEQVRDCEVPAGGERDFGIRF